MPGAGVELAPLNVVDAADEGDNRPLDDGPGNVAHRTRETAHMQEQEDQEPEERAKGGPEDVVDGTHKDPVGHNSDERLPDGTSGDSANDSEKEALDDTFTMRAGRDGHEQALHNTREEAGSHHHQPLDGTCEEPVTSSLDNQFSENTHKAAIEDEHGDGSSKSTHDETGDGNRNTKSHNGTSGEHVIVEGEGTREETFDNECEESDGGGTLVRDISETGRNVVSGEHDESSGNGTHEATTTGAPQEPQSNPPRRRGRPKYERHRSLDRWSNNAVAGRDILNKSKR